MNTGQPPRLATWLLQRLTSGPQCESLIGDLFEQYRNRPSAIWYWRQAITAIVLRVGADLRARPLLALRAVAFGWVLYLLCSVPVNWLTRASRDAIVAWLSETGRYSYWSVLLTGQLSGAVFVSLACAAIGFVVGRMHKHHSASAVCVLAFSVLLFEYGMIALMFTMSGHPPMLRTALILPAVLVMSRPLSILAGGLLSLSADRGAESRVTTITQHS